MNYGETLFAAQRAQLAWAEEARAARCDWLAAEPCPDDWEDPWDTDYTLDAEERKETNP